MKKREFKKHATFEVKLNPVVSESKDLKLSLASIDNLKDFLPDINKANEDLLPIVCNACVVNKFNKNGHGIDTATALKIADNFKYKYINTEHKRSAVIGCLLEVGFAEFGSDKPLSREDAAKMTEPFNLTVGGVIWRTVNEDVANYVEDSADPTSENYLEVSASWELGYNNFLYALGNSRNISECEIVTDQELVKELDAATEKDKTSYNGKNIYILVKASENDPESDPLPLGIGLTENPAADVKGIYTPEKKTEVEAEDNSMKAKEINNIIQDTVLKVINKECENGGVLASLKNSQSNLNNVNIEKSTLNMKKLKDLTKVEEITDDILKVSIATDVISYVQDQVKQASDAWITEKTKAETQIKAEKEKAEKLQAEFDKLTESSKALAKQLEELTKKAEAKEAQDKFTARMSYLDETYTLDEKSRKAIAKRLKDLSDEDYASYQEELAALLTPKSTKVEAETKKEAVASEKKVVEKAISNGEKETVTIPNTSETKTPTYKEKYAKAFAPDQFSVNIRKSR